jgi:hypothetical protein
VTWDALVRRGILTRFSHTWQRREDVEWEMEFTWIGQGEKEQSVAFAKGPSATDFATTVANLVSTLSTAVQASFNVVAGYRNSLMGYVGTIEGAAGDLSDLAMQASNQVLTTVEAAQRTLAVVTTLKDSAAEIVNLCGSTPLRAVKSVADSSQDTFGELCEVDVWVRGVKDAARAIETTSAEQGDEIKTTVDQEDVLAVFVARGNTDLRDVSAQYYNTPDEWRSLMQYNDMTESKLTAGQVVKVPKAQTAGRGT